MQMINDQFKMMTFLFPKTLQWQQSFGWPNFPIRFTFRDSFFLAFYDDDDVNILYNNPWK